MAAEADLAVHEPSLVGPVLRFAFAGMAALALVSVAGAFVLSRIGAEEALRDARTMSRALAVGIVQPALTDALVAGDPATVAAMDRLVTDRLLADPIVRVKLWSPDGRIAYSDVSALVGERFELRPMEEQALRTGSAAASVSPLDAAENRFEQGADELLEVYQPVRTPSGAPLLLEFYLRNDSIASSGQRVWLAFAPVVLGALGVLALLQLPLAHRMSRELRRRHREREALLRRALDASVAERARIAADLHDGIVQDMVGLSLELSGRAAAVGRTSWGADAAAVGAASAGDAASALRGAADRIRRTVGELRTLMIAIHPPNLESAGLEAALSDLVAGLRGRGIEVEVRYDLPARLPAETEALFFRIAQEAIRNVLAHADARHVTLDVRDEGGRPSISVADDGRGFAVVGRDAVGRLDPHSASPPGHLGLRLMHELAARAGASLELRSAPGGGTTVRLTASETGGGRAAAGVAIGGRA